LETLIDTTVIAIVNNMNRTVSFDKWASAT